MKPLSKILTRYPSFQPNQVLTSDHLNDLANYLEQQHRLTRQKLIGIGIVCGLDVDLDRTVGNIKILISQGVGITSQGYLIILENTTCTHVRPFKDKAGYELFVNPTTQEPYPLLEILEDPGETNDPTIEKLSNDAIKTKVVVLYLEILENATNKCLDEGCDEKGKRWEFTVRKLLIDRQVMESIVRTLHGIPTTSTLETYFNPDYQLQAIYIERFGYRQDSGQARLILNDITTLNSFVRGYNAAISDGGVRLARGIHRLYTLYKPLFDLQLGSTANPFAGYDGTNSSTNPFTVKVLDFVRNIPLSVQYVYDFIQDVKATYEELSCHLFELTSQCCPNPNLFPRHLMLGELQRNLIGQFEPNRAYPPSTLRHYFSSAPIYNDQSDLLLMIKQLIQRLVLLISQFEPQGKVDGKSPLKITPSKDCTARLGQQAIPFYYKVEGGERSLLNYWDFETSKRNWIDRLPSYHNLKRSEPLLYGICEYPKLRIEGHVGLPLKDAIAQLQELRTRYNLPFEIIALKLDPTFDSVYLPDDSKIADLQALYLIQRNEVVCCVRDAIRFLELSKLPNSQLNNENIPTAIVLLLFFSMYGTRQTLSAAIFAQAQQTLVLFNQFYQLYIDVLIQLEDELPLDLKDFNINEFKSIYNLANAMSALIKYFINTWGDIEVIPREDEGTAILRERQIFSDLLSIILNYFELLLDKLLDDCLQARFETIYEIFRDRVEQISVFSRFTQENPGIEHIAGTTQGGTFILVYEDRTQTRQITGVITDAENRPLSGVRVRIVARRTPFALTDKAGRFTLNIPEGFRGLTITKPGYYAHNVTLVEGNNTISVRLREAGRQFESGVAETKETVNTLLSNNFSALVDRIAQAGMTSAVSFASVQNIAVSENYKLIDFRENPNFRVVGDFYLPHQISSNHLKTLLKEVCPKEGKDQVIDMQAIGEALAKVMKTNPSFVSFAQKIGRGDVVKEATVDRSRQEAMDEIEKGTKQPDQS